MDRSFAARANRPGALALLLLLFLGCGGSGGGSAGSAATSGGGGAGPDPESFVTPRRSCAYTCPSASCSETTTPYACQNLGAWASIPHEPACPVWDGTFPQPPAGQCTASAPSGDAAKYAGPDPANPGTLILPDGRRAHAAGGEWVFNEADATAGLTTALIAVPGTSWVLTVDSGYGVHAVRAVDASLIGVSDPVTGIVEFPPPATLNEAIAFVPPSLVLVATEDGVVQALSFDTTSGQLTRDDAHSVTLPPSVDGSGNPSHWDVAGVAVSPDGKRLAVTGIFAKQLLLYDLSPATYGHLLGQANLGQAETFGVAFDPHDPTGADAYVSLWDGAAVAEVDISNPAAPVVAHTFVTGKDPEGVVFLDARWMVVASDLGDALSIVDRPSGSVTSVPIDTGGVAHGFDPSTLAFDPTSNHLYATLAGLDAVAWDVDLSATPPTITPAGRLPTAWWPSGVAVMGDGSVVVSSARGHGAGPNLMAYPIGSGDDLSALRGSVQRVPAPSAADLTAGEAAVTADIQVGALAGHPAVTCPPGVHDFPVPETNTEGPSPVIQHVIYIVRENKTFDGLLGDFAGVAGDPALTLKASTADMESIWQNLRALARQFSIGDNYYTSADLSIQGHVWTTYGRTNDFDERQWAFCGDGRPVRSAIDIAGIVDVGRPVEGSLFEWLGKQNVAFDILGEGVGTPAPVSGQASPVDFNYPGGFVQSIGYPDNEKACYLAGRARVLCNLAPVVYATLPNDHTEGASSTRPSPETMCAVNDEATGMVIDALSHSPLWASSIVFVTEDDPSQGGEHIDSHRTLFLAASPWVKRGYVTKTHLDIASVHKLIAHILGIPYPNVQVENAGLPLDLFTSTPDFTPYTYKPRAWPLGCGEAATRSEQRLSETWDLSDVDRNPGLDAQVMRWMRGAQLP